VRVVVVGAGVGGLAAAARLAARGHTVTVCEQAPSVGGKLGRATFAGAVFDTGPSLLTMPHVLAETFAATGAPLGDVLDLQPVEPIAAYRYADGTRFEASADRDTMVTNLDAVLAPGSGADWHALLVRAERMWRAVRGPVLERPIDGSHDVARLALRVRDLAAVAPHATLRGLGRRYLRDPRLRMFLDRYATYTGSDPRRAPAALAVVPFAEQAFGAWYVSGGLHRIAAALAERAAERGATLHLSAPVAAVELAGGRVAGVRLAGGRRVPADIVVANVDAAHLYGDLVRAPAAEPARRRLRRSTPSLSGFVVLLALQGRTPGMAHHTVLFPADYDAEFDALFGSDPRPVADPTLYVAAPRDPTVTPEGGEAWFVLANAARSDQVDWDAPGRTDAYAERLVELLAARGLDVRDRIIARRVISPADLARRTRAPGGAIYGASSSGARAAFLRPANRSPVPGLFLVGGSSHPGGGLPLVLLSARIVDGLVGPA